MVHSILTEVMSFGGWDWLAQVPVVPTAETPEETSVLFSGPQFLVALISGILLAFAVQILLTNLSVAAGISYLGRPSSSHDSDSSSHGSFGGTLRKITTGVGLWTLVSVSIALFVGTYLGVQLSLLVSPGLGAIIGLVIWAAYFSLLVWIGSTTAGSLIGAVVNSATAGLQAILGTAAAAIGGQSMSRQVVATTEAAVAAVRRELGEAVDPVGLRESVEDYVQGLKTPGLDMSALRRDFEDLLNDPELQSLEDSDRLRYLDRQTFLDLVSSRTDFSKEEVQRVADLLEGVWRQTVGRRREPMNELVDYLRSAQPGQVDTQEISAKLDRLIEESRRSRQASQGSGQGSGQGGAMGPVQQTLQMGTNALIGMVMGRTDLADFDVEKILGQVKSLRGQVTEQTDKIRGQLSSEEPSDGVIQADVENYLLNTYSWQMTRETIARDFRDILYDPAADPSQVRHQLEQIARPDFVELLTSRGVFTQSRIQEIADQLELIRREVIIAARGAEERQAALALRGKIETYLILTPKENFTPDEIQRAFGAILEDSEADHESLRLRLMVYDRSTLMQWLLQRQDISPAEVEPILDQLEQTRDRVLFESQSAMEQATQRTEENWQNLEAYLRSTGKEELNPEAIKSELRVLLDDPQSGIAMLRARTARFDRDTLVQLLSQRSDMNEAEAHDVVNQIEKNWYRLRHSPQLLAGQAKAQYDKTTNAIADYLRNTNREELNPEGIQRDLSKMLEEPKAGAAALRHRVAQMDRETLVQLLSQRRDLSEEQVNEIIDQVQSTLRSIVKAPRRLALRTQKSLMNFESTIEDYLRNTDKAELSPEGIKRDFRILMQDPRLGMELLGDRLSHFDHSTLVALLSQREDMTKEEAERVVTQIETVRDQIVHQIQSIRYRIQSVIDRVFSRIRNYLNSLERPELNYEGIKHDVRTLFDDPQAGFDALRDRLSQFDRDTLVAVISSRKDMSEDDANRIIEQIESARDSVLRRAERIQHATQERLEEIKHEAQRQAEETRKAAASASWWLFATALVSGITSAIAGAIAVA